MDYWNIASENRKLRAENESLQIKLRHFIDENEGMTIAIEELRVKVAYLQKEIGECSGGYQTLEKEVADAKADLVLAKKQTAHDEECIIELKEECARLRELLREARAWFHPREGKVPGAVEDMCNRIDAALGTADTGKEGK